MIGDYLFDLATDKKKGLQHWPVKALLCFLSWIYGAFIRCLSAWQAGRQRQLGCRVVSVGNLTTGGTGKTPLVMLAAGFFSGRGRKTAVLTRGYKGKDNRGDEPVLLARKLPGVRICVDKDRLRSGSRAVKECQAAVAVLDDGFQQWRLKKDLDIVTIDAREGFGNFRMLPAGLLREPLAALRRADILVITNTHLCPDVSAVRRIAARYNPAALVVEADLVCTGLGDLPGAAEYPLSELAGRPVGLFCGIAKPESFEETARKLGFKIVYQRTFSDHYRYTRGDLEAVCSEARAAGARALLTTEKDACRFDRCLSDAINLPAYTLVVNIRLTTNEKRFYDRLSALLPA